MGSSGRVWGSSEPRGVRERTVLPSSPPPTPDGGSDSRDVGDTNVKMNKTFGVITSLQTLSPGPTRSDPPVPRGPWSVRGKTGLEIRLHYRGDHPPCVDRGLTWTPSLLKWRGRPTQWKTPHPPATYLLQSDGVRGFCDDPDEGENSRLFAGRESNLLLPRSTRQDTWKVLWGTGGRGPLT